MSHGKLYFVSGEVLPYLLAEAWNLINSYTKTKDEVLLYEIRMRELLEEGIRVGDLKKFDPNNLIPVFKPIIFEDAAFSWNEVRSWAKKQMKEDWPSIPPWEVVDSINHAIDQQEDREDPLTDLIITIEKAVLGKNDKELVIDRNEMPGTKSDLYELARKISPDKFKCKFSTFKDWLKKSKLRFKSGSRSTDFYRKLFPLHFSD